MYFSTIKRLLLCWRQDDTESANNEHPRPIELTQLVHSRAGLIDIPEPQNQPRPDLERPTARQHVGITDILVLKVGDSGAVEGVQLRRILHNGGATA